MNVIWSHFLFGRPQNSFIIGVDVAKSGGFRCLKALEFEKWGAPA